MATSDPDPADEGRLHGTDFRRFEAFSDGVLAIAITLLVLQFDVPSVPKDDPAALDAALRDLMPDLFAYTLSFAVIGRLWIVHHRAIDRLERFDGGLVALNMLFLALVILVPFTSELLGSYPSETPSVVAYALVLALESLTLLGMSLYAVARGLVHPRHAEAAAAVGGRRALLLPMIFLMSIPVAFFVPVIAQAMWVGTFFVRPGRAPRSLTEGS